MSAHRSWSLPSALPLHSTHLRAPRCAHTGAPGWLTPPQEHLLGIAHTATRVALWIASSGGLRVRCPPWALVLEHLIPTWAAVWEGCVSPGAGLEAQPPLPVHSLLSDCGCNVTRHFTLLLQPIPHRDELCPLKTTHPKKPFFLSSVASHQVPGHSKKNINKDTTPPHLGLPSAI